MRSLHATTVVYTAERDGVSLSVAATLVAGTGTSSGRQTHDSGRVCFAGLGMACDCGACRHLEAPK